MSGYKYETTVRLLRAGADPTRFGSENLQRFKADIKKGLLELSGEPSRDYAERHAERSKQLAEIVAWMKSHGHAVSDDASIH